MSDKIDIPIEASGDDGVNRVTSAIDRLHESLIRLGENSAVGRLAQQMELMQATMATGFAGLAASMEKMVEGMGARQVRAIEENGDKAAVAITEAGLKIKAADAKTWEQIQRGSAANVTAAFAQLAEGIPIEAVLARFGELATGTALAFEGEVAKLNRYQGEMAAALEKGVDRQLAIDRAFEQARIDLAAKAAAEHQALVEKRDLEEYRIRSATATEMQALIEKRDLEEYRIRSEASAQLQALIEKRDMEEYQARSTATQRLLEIEQRRDLELYTLRSAEAQRLAEIQQRRDTEEYTAAQAQAQRIIEIEQRRDLELHSMRVAAAADAARTTERDAHLNVSYRAATPVAQAQTQVRAILAADEGLDPAKLVGSKAAADAARKSLAELYAIIEQGRAGTKGAAAGNRVLASSFLELDGALRQAEGAFRGAAHQAGVYGLHHGQLIALLAGGAVAAGLHHIAETGAEVEFQLASLNALSGEMAPIDVNKFIGMTAGTMTGLKDAAEGMHALAQAGQDQSAAFAALPDVMRLASLGEMTVGQAAEMAVESMHAFGKEITDLGNIGDILVAVGAKSNLSVHKLAEDMKSAAVTGALFNLSMEEITATVGALAERGLTIQPLSSALNKLYEPSAKTAKVMKEWNLDVKDGEGNLKNYTQFMTELATKVNEFRVPADALKQLGMSTQSIKAMEVMTQHLDAYTHLLHEAEDAHGKMFNAMIAKEDTVEGSWKRLGSTVEGSLVGAFEHAKPIIREVEESLMHMAGSDEFKNALANIATGVARLTQTIVEGIGPLTTMAGVYVGLRVISAATTWINQMVIAQRAQAVAAAASTAALRTETVQLELFATAENAAAAGGVRVATSLDLVAIGARGLTAAFGWLSLGVIAITTGIDLLGGQMAKHDEEHLKQQNSFNNTIDAIDREIDRLKGLEDQLRKTGETGTAAAAQVAIMFAQTEEANAKSALDKARTARPEITATTGMSMVGGLSPTMSADTIKQNAVVDAAQIAYDKAHAATVKAMNAFAELESREESVKTLTDVSSLRKKIHDMPDEVKPLEKTEAARQAAEYANESLRALKGQEVTEANVVQMAKLYAEVEKDVAATKRVVSALPDDKDGARVRIEQLQEELRLKQQLTKTEIDDLKSQNKRGELGDLQLINAELDKKLTLDRLAVNLAKEELAAAGPLKPGQQEKYNSRIKSAEGQLTVDRASAERARQDLFDKMETQELQARAKALESKGRLEDAYNLTWQAKNANLMANLASDIEAAENAQYRDRLVRFQAFMEEQRRLGANDARFKEGKEAFGAAQSELNARLGAANLQNGPGSGLYSSLSSTMQARQAYADLIPKMQAAQVRVAASSSSLFGGDDSKLKEAQNELRAIQEQMAALRNTGVSMAQEIGKALTEAFGKGGTAMGGMLTAAANYGAKLGEIQTALAASDKGPEAQAQAAAATASAQIKGYGDMAGAAKGFFDTNSNGYRVLRTTEQAFRAFELAQALMATSKKIFFKETEVAANTALNGTKVAGEAAATTASTVLAGTEASAWGVTAVAKAIASLPFPMNLVAGAATMAAIVGLGIKLTGGFGGGSSAAERQADNGTGTIAGDPKAKTESLAKSLALVEKNTYNNLAVSQDMLNALRSINSNISGFAGLILQNTNIANPDVRLSSGIGKTGWAQADMTATGAEIGLAVAGPAGAAVGATLGYVASKIPVIQKLYSSIFGGKQSLDDSGFTLGSSTLGDIASRGVNAQTYADVTTSGGWFRSDSHDTKTGSVGDEANRAITQIIAGMGSAVKTAGAILGLSGADFEAQLNSFVVDIGKISLKGLSSSEQQAAIQAAFSKVGDQMAQSAVSTITQFSKAGEGALETLTRVAADYQTVDAVFKSFGTTFAEVGVGSIAARERLIDLAGGLDKFTSQAEFFFKNFLTTAQQTAANRAAVQPTLAKYGLSTEGRDAVQNFADVTIAFGAMGAAGAEAYTELMNIAPAFKAVTDVAKDLQNQIDDLLMTQAQKDAATRATLDPTNQLLFDQLQQAKAVSQARSVLASSYQSEAQALQSSVDKLKSFATSLRSFLNSLQLSDASPLNPADKYGAALSQFNTTLAKAQAGDSDAQSSLQSVAQAFLQASKGANASNSTYQSDYQRVVSAVNAMANTATAQATDGQTNLAALRQQISQLTALNETSMSIVQAINNLAVALTGGKDAKTNSTAVESLYQELLGRTADVGGAAFYNNLLQQGVSLSVVIDDIKSSAEYLARIGQVPATTTVTPSTQYGSAPVPSAPTSTLSTNSGNAQLDVATLYWQLFNRAPDQAGLDYWTGVANKGNSLDSIRSGMMSGTEYQQMHPAAYTAPALPVTQDPYTAMAGQNEKIVAGLAAVTDQLATLRTEQDQQSQQQVAATMQAGSTTGETVAGAITSKSRQDRWDSQNEANLR